MKQKANKKLSHEEKIIKCEEFLKTYEDYDIGDHGPSYDRYGRKKYLIDIVKLVVISAKDC